MAQKDTFGLGPLDRVISEYEQSVAAPSAPGIAPRQDDASSEIDTRQPDISRAGSGSLTPPAAMVPVFEAASLKYNVPVNVLMALAQQESGYDPLIRGHEMTKWGRAQGLMQYLPSTAKMLGINPYDARQAIDAAAMQIRERLDKGYSMDDAVMEHFAGPDRRLWGPKTAQYGVDVLGKARRIGAAMYGGDEQTGVDLAANGPANPFLTQGNMSSRQDGPMSVPAGTDTRKLNLTAAEPEPEDAPVAYEDRSWFDKYVGDRIKGGFKGLKAGLAGGAAGFDARQIEAIDRIDRGETVLDADDPIGYAHMTDPAMRAAVKEQLGQAFLKSIGEVATLRKEQQAIPQHPEVRAALQAKSFSEFWDHFKKAPMTFIANVGVESAPAMLPGMIAGGIAGIGLRAGATGFAAGLGAGSYGVDYQSSVLEALGDMGVDVTNKDSLEKAFRDPNTMEQVRKLAHAHASVVGALDAASGGVAGKTLVKGASIAARAGNIGAQTAVQGTLGAAGEAGGQLAQGKTDLDAGQIAAEFFGEAVGAPVEVGGAVLSKRHGGGQNATPNATPGATTPNRTGPIGRAVQAGNDNAGARRVVVTTKDGQTLTGFLDDYQDDGQGGFSARVLADDGRPYQFTSADGVSITPERTGAPALPAPTITVDRAGNAATTEQRQQRAEQDQAAQEANRKRREELGMSPDVDRVVQAHKERTSLPDEVAPGTPVEVITRDGEVINGTATDYTRTEDGARVALTDQNGDKRLFSEAEISEVIPQEQENDDSGNATGLADEREAGAGKPAKNKGNKPKRGKKDATGAAPQVAPVPVEPSAGVREGVADASGPADQQPALSEPRDLASMSLDELVEHRKYLSTQARKNRGWDKLLLDEKNKVEGAIRAIDPAALEQFTTSFDGPQPISPDVVGRPTETTTPEGKALLQFSMPDGDPILVRQDHFEDGRAKLAAFTPTGHRRTGPRTNVMRTSLRALPTAEPAPASVTPTGAKTEPIRVTSGLKPTEAADTQAAKPKKASKEDADHLFGVDQKREKALERIAKGRAWFSDQKKADAFITKNGLADTHEVEQTGVKRFEVKEKAARQQSPDGAEAIHDGDSVVAINKNTGNVVDRGIYRGDDPRTGSARIEVAPGRISMRHRDDYEINAQRANAGDDAGATVATARPEPAGVAAQPKKKPAAKSTPAQDRAKQIIGADVGDVVMLSDEVGYVSAGTPMEITDIDKKGTIYVRNPATGGATSLSPGDLIGASRRGVTFERRESGEAVASADADRGGARQMGPNGAPVPNLFTGKPDPQNSASINELGGFKVGDAVSIPNRTFGNGLVETLFTRAMTGSKPLSMARVVREDGKRLDVITSELKKEESAPAKKPVTVTKTPGVTTIVIDPSALRAEPSPAPATPSASAGVYQQTLAKYEDRASRFGRDKIREEARSALAGLALDREHGESMPDFLARNPDVAERQRAIQDWLAEKPASESAAPSPDPVAPSTADVAPEPKPADARFANNKIFTADRVAAARARLKSKLNQLNSGIDPEVLMDGLTITGAYVEEGVRDFSAYAKAMAEDFGDAIKPYLLSFWEGVRNYPGLNAEGMTPVDEARAAHAALMVPADAHTEAVGEIVKKPAKRTRKTGAKQDITLTQDWGVDKIDGYSDEGEQAKAAFMKEARQYLNAVSEILTENGYTPHMDAKGRPMKPVSVNESGVAGSGDISLTLAGPDGVGVYAHIGDSALRGVVPTTTSGIAVMFRAAQNSDKFGVKGTNQWAPTDLSAADLAALIDTHVKREARNGSQKLDKPSAGALARVPAEPLQGVTAGGQAGDSAQASSRVDAQGNDRPGSGRDDKQRGVGSRQGTLSLPEAGDSGTGRSGEQGAGNGGRDSGSALANPRTDVDKPAVGTTAAERGTDYAISDPDDIGKGGAKTKYRNNVAAINLLRQIEAENRPATRDEQAILSKFVGWGGLPQAFERSDGGSSQGWDKEVAELKALLTPEEYSAAAASTRNAHYTSPAIVKAMWAGMRRLGFNGGRVLEPSLGVGNFFGLMPTDLRNRAAMHGVELDNITGGIAKLLYPAAKITSPMGFQDYTIPDGYFDAAIGNPPFGSEKLYDRDRKDLSGFSIHNYFFAKTIDGLKPNGVMAMVVTNRMMDVVGDKARRYMADRSELLGAVRLPNNAFLGNAGTEVTTDILFLRRLAKGEKPTGETWMDVRDFTDKDGKSVPLNEYFHRHPENMLGEFGQYGSMYSPTDPALVARPGQDTAALLDTALARLPENVAAPSQRDPVIETVTPSTSVANVKVGSAFMDGDTVMVREPDLLGEPQAKPFAFQNAKAAERVTGMIGVRDALTDLRMLQLDRKATDAQLNAARARLNTVYDAFTKDNGPINLDANKRLFRDDPTWPQISALEESFDRGLSATVAKKTGEKARKPSAKKAAIFSKRTQSPYQAPTSAKSAKDALVASLAETGRVDMDLMQRLYGKAAPQIVSELEDLIYQDPVKGWVTRDEYLSGNVKAKLAQAQKQAATDPAYQRNVEALTAVQPQDVEAVDIRLKPGASWVPPKHMADFADHISEAEGAEAFYNPGTAKWIYRNVRGSEVARQRYSTGRVTLLDVLNSVANQRAITVYDRHSDGSRSVNETETQLANERAKAVRDEWDTWIWSDDARRTALSRLYNDMFNTDVKREFDGSHLTLPGKVGDDIIKLRPHQANAVWRIIQSDTTLTDHVVGAGKAGSLDSKLLTPRGWIRMGDVKVGDYVITQSGAPTMVEAIFPQGEKDIFKVTFSDGSSTECCDEHLWLTRTYRERTAAIAAQKRGKQWPSAQPKVRPLSVIRETLVAPHLGAKNHSIPLVQPVQLEARSVPLDPYLLGALIGDGNFTHRSVTFCKPDREIVYSFGLPEGCSLRENESDSRCVSWSIVGDNGKNPALDALRDLGLQGCKSPEKFVPDDYKFNTVDVRLAVLRGLMDADGWVEKNGKSICFSSASERLADDVTFLVQSLGGVTLRSTRTPTYTYKGERRQGALAYSLVVKMPPDINPFHTSAKARLVVPKTKYAPVRYIVSVEPIGKKPAQCIRVADPSHLYVADDFIVTHNTYTLIAGAMELRRMGLAKKPMFVVPNHLVGQWAADFNKLYPGANVLAASKRDFEKDHRKRLFARIATGDWDAVIVAHSSFGKVEVEPEKQAAYIEEQIADLITSQEAMREAEGKSSRNAKKVNEQITKLREKIKKLLDAGSKDDSLYWGELGVDALFVDEFHEFKNLAFSTSMQKVAGLGTRKGSNKATDMMLKIRQVLEATGGRNVVTATGTPISNTMAEMYTLQRYLDGKNLAAQGLAHFDAWARQFGEVVTDWELSPSGQYKMNSRFAKFVNMPELMQRYTSFADVVNRDDINRMLASQGKTLPVPRMRGGKPENVVVERSPMQARYIGEPIKDADGNDTEQYPEGTLVWRAENLPKKPEKGADNMLKIMSDARKAALDMRLIDPSAGDYAGSKINVAAGRIVDLYHQWDADKGTQLVFIDLSTPKHARNKEAARIRKLMDDAEAGDEAAQEALDRISPDEISALESEFSVYDDLKAKLVARGIPENEIAFIHDANTELQKEELFGKVRSGRVRVLFGSTAKMGAGMNVQDRLVALHHMDAPWRPSDLEQREGRIIRQGNILRDRDPDGFEVDVVRYATKQTLDSRMWQTIEGKARMIEQVRKGDMSVREIEDVGGEAANAAEMKAASSGNPLILEEMTLRNKVRDLENERSGFNRAQFRLRDSIKGLEANLKYGREQLKGLREDIKRAQPKEFAATIAGETFDKRREAGEAILAHIVANGESDLGTYGGFSVHAETGIGTGVYYLVLRGTLDYTTEPFDVLVADPQGVAQRMVNAVKHLDQDIAQRENKIAAGEKDLPRLKAQVEPWSKTDELAETNRRHAAVIDQLRPKKKAAPTDAETKAEPPSDVKMSVTPVTETPAFKRWFGDSKVVDTEGKPLIVYHGTPESFTTFDDEFTGGNDGNLDWGPGFYFTDTRAAAQRYTHGTGSVMEVYLSIKNPAPRNVVERVMEQPGAEMDADYVRDTLSDMGYDGIVIEHKGGEKEIVAFHPEQIKSATGNRGTFDPANPDIRYSVATESGDMGASARGMASLESQTPLEIRSTKVQRDTATPALRDQVFAGLRDASLHNPDVGDIAIGRKGWSKSRANASDTAKLLTVPRLPEIIEDGAYIGSQPAGKGKSGAFHYIARRVNVDGVPLTALVTVEEHPDGTLSYYNHSILNDNFAPAPTGPVDGLLASYRRPSFKASGPLTRDQGRAAAHGTVYDTLTQGPLGGLVEKLISDGHIVLHLSENTLPRSIRLKGGTAIQGFTQDGIVNLVGENLTPQTAMPVLLHEFFHAKGENLIGTPKWNNLNRRLERMYEGAKRRKAEGRVKDGDFWDGALRRVEAAERGGATGAGLAEEFGAYAIENYDFAPSGIRKWVENVIGMVKDWLYRRFGIQAGDVTPAQLHALAVAVLRSMEGTQPIQARTVDGHAFGSMAMSATDVTGTPAFKTWFGDSRVVDAEGKPLVVYKGMLSNDWRTGTPINVIDSPNGPWAGFFSSKPDVASTFADAFATMGDAAVFPVYLSIKRPLVIDAKGKKARDFQFDNLTVSKRNQTLLEAINDPSNDGVIIRNTQDEGDVYIPKRPRQIKSATGNRGTFDPSSPNIMFSVTPDLKEATEALDTDTNYLDYAGLPDASGAAIRDMTSRYMKYVAHPRHIAALFKDFVPVFRTANRQQQRRNEILEALHTDYKAYDSLPEASKRRVNQILELGRLTGNVYRDGELKAGVKNPGYTYTVVRDENGEPHRVREAFDAALMKVGDTVTLSDAEIDAYRHLRTMFDAALDRFRNQAMKDFGLSEFVGKADPVQAMRDSIKGKPEASAEVRRMKNAIQFVGDIEQSKRTGYVPFSRYGDYVIAVKERRADIRYEPDGQSFLVRNLPEDMDEVADRVGASYDPDARAWRVTAEQRRDLERENERTVYSEKVETGLRDKFGRDAERKVRARERDVAQIPSVREAIKRIEAKYVDGTPGRRIVSFETTKKRGEGGIDLTALDALAEVAQIDNPTWDAVRAELQKALQAGGFRKHFFQSSHVPGYTPDFQRAMADYIVGMAGYLSRREHNDAWESAIAAIKGGKLHEYATKYRAYFNDPREEFAALRQAAFVWKIGANISSAFVNLTQTLLTTVPTLNQVAGRGLVAMELTRAARDALKMFSHKAGTNVFDMSKAPADLRAEFARADAAGLFLPLNSFDLMGQANQRTARARRVQKIGNVATSVISLPFSASERFNRIVAFTAAARLARRKGMTERIRRHFKNDKLAWDTFGKKFDSYDFAEWLASETQFQMGKINRPTMMRGAGAAMFQFKSFTFQLLEKMYRDWTLHGVQGKIAVASTVAMLVAFSGLWGVPGADDLRKLLEFMHKQITNRNIDLKDEMRQAVFAATDNLMITDALSSGMPYHFGMDLSRRVGMGNVLPEQFNKTGVDWLDMVSMVGGPGFDMLVAAPIRATGLVAAGNPQAAVQELAPVWAKNPMQAYQWNTDAVRTRRGDKVLDRSEISDADIGLKAFGFQPSRVSRQYEMTAAQYGAQRSADDLKRSLKMRFVRALEKRAANKDSDRAEDLQTDFSSALEAIRDYNRTAAPDQRIKMDRSSIRQMVIRERLGGRSTLLRTPKASRRGAATRAEAYGLGSRQ